MQHISSCANSWICSNISKGSFNVKDMKVYQTRTCFGNLGRVLAIQDVLWQGRVLAIGSDLAIQDVFWQSRTCFGSLIPII